MEDIDKDDLAAGLLPDDDEQLLHEHVIQGDHGLLYLDTYLRELFRPV